MSKSIFFIGIIILLSCTIIASGETLTVGPNQPFTTIQSAIDSAQPYDIIQVSCGIYHESIQLLKPISLHGETGCTIITHPDDADIITVSADNCTITGFTIQNGRNESYSGLYILSDGNRIANNSFINNSGWGVYLYHCSQNELFNNSFTNDGICMVGTKDEWLSMKVEQNTVEDHPIIWLKHQQSTIINTSFIGQLVLINATNCQIENTTVSSTDQGIVLAYSDNCTITDSTINHCRFGLRMQYATSNRINDNIINQNSYGLYVTHSDDNLFIKNTIKDNTLYGCYFCCNSKHNIISQNTFINNTATGYDYFDNTWSKDGIGNFYSDYLGNDENSDGIGETPYQIPPDFGESIDAYPIVDFEKIQTTTPTDSPGFLLILVILSCLFLITWKKRRR